MFFALFCASPRYTVCQQPRSNPAQDISIACVEKIYTTVDNKEVEYKVAAKARSAGREARLVCVDSNNKVQQINNWDAGYIIHVSLRGTGYDKGSATYENGKVIITVKKLFGTKQFILQGPIVKNAAKVANWDEPADYKVIPRD
jgi:hypothetical protein